MPVQAQSAGVCVCENYYSMPNTFHMPLAASPLATCFDFSTQIHKKKNPNANENETNVGVKMKTFVRKRENSLSVCACFPLCACVCVCGQWAVLGYVSSASASALAVRRHSSDVHAWSSLAFWATAAAACRSGSTVVCSGAHRSSYSASRCQL